MKNKFIYAALVGLVFSVSSAINVANAGLITLTGPSVSNVDNLTATLVELESFETGIINDLNLAINMTGISYDLSVLLTHVDTGSAATIWLSDNLNGGHYFSSTNTLFDDEAMLDFHPNYSTVAASSYRSVDLLSIFDGEQISGTWQLSITNTGCCDGEGDELVAWSIMADVTDVPEPTSLAIFALGLIGLASRRLNK
jgi:hypothetical protein